MLLDQRAETPLILFQHHNSYHREGISAEIVKAVPHSSLQAIDTEKGALSAIPIAVSLAKGRPAVLVTEMMSRFRNGRHHFGESDEQRKREASEVLPVNHISAGVRMHQKLRDEGGGDWHQLITTVLDRGNILELAQTGDPLPEGVYVLTGQPDHKRVAEVVAGLLAGEKFPDLLIEEAYARNISPASPQTSPSQGGYRPGAL